MTGHISYLEAKRELDDRSLDRRVLSIAFGPLSDAPRIVEVGAGTLTMVERLHEWGVLDGGEWTAIDSHARALRHGRRRLLERPDATATDDGVALGTINVRLRETDAFTYEPRGPPAALLVGCAFFDLVDLDRLSAFAPFADRVYAPITYDGTTSFEPADREDEAVLSAYREHMESHRPGTPDGARALRAALASVDRVGASPWEIVPPYRIEEARVVDAVLETIERAVAETGFSARGWADRRRAQLAEGKLRYRAENVDIYGRM